MYLSFAAPYLDFSAIKGSAALNARRGNRKAIPVNRFPVTMAAFAPRDPSTTSIVRVFADGKAIAVNQEEKLRTIETSMETSSRRLAIKTDPWT